jgi:fucose 4-O-acetylase-like acetyltransferase
MRDATGRDARLDIAKALAISFVLFYHLKPLRLEKSSSLLIGTIDILLKGIYVHITLFAVPLFILVSLYLFYQKIEYSSGKYIVKRINRLAEVYLFWTFCQFAMYYGNLFLKSIQNDSVNYSISIPLSRLLVQGGPPIPIVGGSVFYFMFVLLVLVFFSFVYSLMRKLRVMHIYAGVVIAISFMIYFEFINLNGGRLPYWRIDNFLIYIPISYFIYKQENENLKRYIYLFWFGFIVFFVQDIFIRNLGYNTGPYSRLSIVFGSVSIFSSILLMKNIKASPIAFFLSKYSLGIFATHKYMQFIVIISLQYLGVAKQIYIAGFPVEFRSLIIAILSFLLVSFVVLIMYRTPLKRFVC